MAVPNAAVGDVFRVRVVIKASDQLAFNVGYFRVTAVGGGSQSASQIAGKFDVDAAASYLDVLSQNAVYMGVDVQRIVPTPPDNAVAATTNSGAGNIVSDLLPPAVAAVIKLKTDSAGRRYRGRKYVPFAGESVNDAAGSPQAGYLTDLAVVGGFWSAAHVPTVGGNSATLTPIIWHRSDSSWTDVVGFVVRSEWGQQRRRSSLRGADSLIWP